MPDDSAPDDAPPPIPAATTVVLRDAHDGAGRPTIEVLTVRRNAALEFAGGMWVFPGGRVDPADHVPGAADGADGAGGADPDPDAAALAAARRAAVREAAEETGLVVDEASLVWFSHWTPPSVTPKRFATWFFVAPAPPDAGAVRVDGGEIHDHAWFVPAEARRRRDAGEIALAPPTWITLEQLDGFTTVAEAVTTLGSRPPEHFTTRFAAVEGGAVALYHGDAGYESGDLDAPGGRHRLWMLADRWHYERTAV